MASRKAIIQVILYHGSLDSNTRQNGEILINVCRQALAFGTTDGEARSSHFKNLLRQNMLTFWKDRLVEIRNSRDIRYKHVLPFARIRKIMKSDKKVKMISSDTPILFAKACELFILDLTLRAWMNAEDNSRQSLRHCDVFTAIMGEELLSFLAKIISSDRYQKEISADSHGGDTHQCPANPMNTKERPAYPMTLQNLNSALLMRSPEAPQHLVFPPSFSAAETNYRQGSNEQTLVDCPGGTDQYPEYPMNLHNLNSALLTRSYAAPQHHAFLPSFSSTENNYRQGFNDQTVADCRGDTNEHLANPMNFHNLNSFSLRSQEGPQHLVFPPEFSSVETNYLPDLNDQTVADYRGDTNEHLANPMNFHNLNSIIFNQLSLRRQEEPQHLVFPPEFSSAETNYLPDLNDQTVANCRGDTNEHPANPMNFHNLNSIIFNQFSLRSQEGPQHLVFPPESSSAETNYLPNLNGQTIADCRGDTNEHPANPMNFHNLNSIIFNQLLLRRQEGPQHLVSPPEFSSAETNYLPDLNE
ncbi:nuclear transcription factor Y subunit gamma-like isoform X6 [Olea europaea var. sylvestris]|uniref:nuclear transcription factor Y subunit gamma-like isoform X6 n=1 Tax=Olea europaea var. sylvestris TaxID=158386 RepID=UPI000C1D0B86|nr:nuclear transcription factor Y subunit gamma-like isoform X6 [Olea europaea var. sylvestris]